MMVGPIKAEHLVEEPHKIGPKALGVVLSHQYLIKSPLAFKSRMAKKTNSVDNTTPGLSLESIDQKNQQHATLDARQIFILSANNFSVQNMLLQASLHTTSQAPLPQVPLLFHPGADLAEVNLRSRCPLQGSTQGPCPVVAVLNTWMANFPSTPFIYETYETSISKYPWDTQHFKLSFSNRKPTPVAPLGFSVLQSGHVKSATR